MVVRKRGSVFETDLSKGGMRYRRSFTTGVEAEAWELESRARLLRGERPVLGSGAKGPCRTVTVRQLACLTIETVWLRATAELRNAEIAYAIADRLGGERLVSEITLALIEKQLLRPWRQRGLAPGTINRYRTVAMVMFRVAVQNEFIDSLPAWKTEPYKHVDGKIEGTVDRVVSDTEQAALLGALRGEDAQLAGFLLATGIRIGEALRLSWDDLDLDRGLVHIHQSKSGRPRTVPLTQRGIQTLPQRNGSPQVWQQKARSFRDSFQRAKQAAGIQDKDLTPHVLRHTYATRLLAKGCPLLTVSQLLGHSSILVTAARYAHADPNHVESARRFLNEVGA